MTRQPTRPEQPTIPGLPFSPPPAKSGPGTVRRQLLERLDRAWTSFQDSYAGLSEAEMLEPGVTKAWSVRDLIAHVTTWEEEALHHLPTVLAGRTPPRYSVTYGGIDAFNAQTTKRKAGLTLAEVLLQQEEVHRSLLEVIEDTPEERLRGGTRFRHRLRLDTYGHYPKHEAGIRRWRALKGL